MPTTEPLARPSAVVDIHSHVIADDAVRFPVAPMRGQQSAWSQERPVTHTQMVAAMDAAGIDQAVLVQASTCYGHDNRYVVASMQAHPTRFAGVGSVDLNAPDAIAQLDAWQAQGLGGVRVFIAGHTAADHDARLDDPRAFPAWAHAEKQGIPISVQLRAPGLPQLVNLLERFPNAVVVLDHFARPVLEDGAPYAAAAALFDLARYPRLHFKLTTHNVRESREGRSTQADFVRKVVDTFGAQRIAWGSNFPASAGSLSGLLDEALEATASLGAEEREWIFHRTARSLHPELQQGAK